MQQRTSTLCQQLRCLAWALVVPCLSRLDEAGEWLVECDTGEALLARLQQARWRPPPAAPAATELNRFWPVA